jgi:hypothetical protein
MEKVEMCSVLLRKKQGTKNQKKRQLSVYQRIGVLKGGATKTTKMQFCAFCSFLY